MTSLNRWQDPEHGFPTGEYFDAVGQALTDACIEVDGHWRDEPYDATFELGPSSRKHYVALYIGWRVAEDSDPMADEWHGVGDFCGWHWAPYSKPGEALADFAKDLPVDLLAEPAEVAAAVRDLVKGTGR